MFFLAGTAGSGTVTRDQCTVPFGRLLFFPLFNAFDVHTPGDGLDTPALVYEDFLKFGFRADTLHASVDGVAVRHLDPATTPYRGVRRSRAAGARGAFSLVFPDANLFGHPGGDVRPSGRRRLLPAARSRCGRARTPSPSAARATSAGPTSQDITYHLRVVR